MDSKLTQPINESVDSQLHNATTQDSVNETPTVSNATESDTDSNADLDVLTPTEPRPDAPTEPRPKVQVAPPS